MPWHGLCTHEGAGIVAATVDHDLIDGAADIVR